MNRSALILGTGLVIASPKEALAATWADEPIQHLQNAQYYYPVSSEEELPVIAGEEDFIVFGTGEEAQFYLELELFKIQRETRDNIRVLLGLAHPSFLDGDNYCLSSDGYESRTTISDQTVYLLAPFQVFQPGRCSELHEVKITLENFLGDLGQDLLNVKKFWGKYSIGEEVLLLQSNLKSLLNACTTVEEAIKQNADSAQSKQAMARLEKLEKLYRDWVERISSLLWQTPELRDNFEKTVDQDLKVLDIKIKKLKANLGKRTKDFVGQWDDNGDPLKGKFTDPEGERHLLLFDKGEAFYEKDGEFFYVSWSGGTFHVAKDPLKGHRAIPRVVQATRRRLNLRPGEWLKWRDRAEQKKRSNEGELAYLREELKNHIKHNRWSSAVERTYLKLVELEKEGEFNPDRIHVIGAQAAFSRGDILAAYYRFKRALSINPDNEDARAGVEKIPKEYGYVKIFLDSGVSAKLLVNELPVEPIPRNAIELAREKIRSERSFTGLLPVGKYSLGPDMDILVNPGSQQFVVRASGVTKSPKLDTFDFDGDENPYETPEIQRLQRKAAAAALKFSRYIETGQRLCKNRTVPLSQETLADETDVSAEEQARYRRLRPQERAEAYQVLRERLKLMVKDYEKYSAGEVVFQEMLYLNSLGIPPSFEDYYLASIIAIKNSGSNFNLAYSRARRAEQLIESPEQRDELTKWMADIQAEVGMVQICLDPRYQGEIHLRLIMAEYDARRATTTAETALNKTRVYHGPLFPGRYILTTALTEPAYTEGDFFVEPNSETVVFFGPEALATKALPKEVD